MPCHWINLPSGGTAHVNVADDIGFESMQAVFAVAEAADKQLQRDILADKCAAVSPHMCNVCPYNDDCAARCQCV